MTPPTYPWMSEDAQAAPGNASLIARIDTVSDTLHLQPNDRTPPESVASSMAALSALKAEIDSTAADDEVLKRRADGILGEGAYKLVQSELISATSDDGGVDTLASLIEYCSYSDDPEVHPDTEESFEHTASWGSPASRVHAAEACLDLCLKRPALYPRFSDRIDSLLADPHPAVRINAGRHLIRLRDVDRDGFWRRAETIIVREENRAVLASFVVDVLGGVMGIGGANEVAALVLPLLDRMPSPDRRVSLARAKFSPSSALRPARLIRRDAGSTASTYRSPAWTTTPLATRSAGT